MQCACGKPAGENMTRCNMCQARYMRDYRQKARQRIERRAYLRGAEEARVKAITTFQNLGDAEMNGNAAAEILKRLCFT